MSEEGIPEDIRRFLLLHIDSVAQLEALLLMHSHPHQDWDAAALAQRLYISPAETVKILLHLAAQQLCRPSSQPNSFRIETGNPELKALLMRLAEVYSRRLIAITTLIHQNKPPGQNPNNAKRFADAFKFFKDKEDG